MKHEKRPEDWNAQEKLAVIIQYGALEDNRASQLCREQGIYPHHIKQWSSLAFQFIQFLLTGIALGFIYGKANETI